MIILLDMGHCLSGADTGAQGNGRNEQDCTREIGYKVKSKLESLGHQVVICSIDSASTVGESLSYRVNTANNAGGDLFVSIHLNAGGGQGVEIYTYAGRQLNEAKGVLNEIVALGFNNRGIKDGTWLYVIQHTSMSAMLVECCFIDSEDMNRYNAENFAAAIVKGITGQVTSEPQPTPQPPQPVQPDQPRGDASILEVQRKLNRLQIRGANGQPLVEDGIKGTNTDYAIRKFQEVSGISIDGIWGNQTEGAYNAIVAKPLLQVGSKGIAVRYVQFRVGAGIDGDFGNQTKNAVINWQSGNGLSADGIVGNMTWRKLIG